MIAALVQCTSKNTGYSLLDLLTTATGRANLNTDYPRACSITIQYLGSTDGYIVPNEGAYANTADVPTQYGYSFSQSGTYWEKSANHNLYALDEIILGVGADGETFAVTVYAT